MDDGIFNIKADDYEPDLFNDMSVQEEITVGSCDNMIGGYHGSNTETDFPNNRSTINLINNNSIIHQGLDMKQKPQYIYIKSKPNNINSNINNNIRTVKFPNNQRPIKVIRINQQLNATVPNIGSNLTRVMNPNMVRSLQITKLNNFNMTQVGGGGPQRMIIGNRTIIPTNINNATSINYLNQPTNFKVQLSQANTINFQNMSGQHIQQHHFQHQQQQPNQTALKLEPGDSGFYNLTGGTGPTRYYPRASSPDKDSLDGSQEQMANVYKTNGLRKYARSVCDKVKEKGTTTYSEVADELVHEYAAEHPMIPPDQLHYIQKNIRRRVYDALNVLMALKVLDKEKKEIKWKGLPVNLLEECKQLEDEKARKTELLQQRVEELSELMLQLISYKNLVGRNRQKEKEGTASAVQERIKLPFLVVSTNNSTVIDCNISPQRLDYLFTFDQPFEMQDEFQTLKQSGFTLRLGTSQCTESQYKRCLELVPNTLRFYVEAIYQQRSAIVPDFVSLHRRNMAAAATAQSRSQKVLGTAATALGSVPSIVSSGGGGGGGYRSSGGATQAYWPSTTVGKRGSGGAGASHWGTGGGGGGGAGDDDDDLGHKYRPSTTLAHRSYFGHVGPGGVSREYCHEDEDDDCCDEDDIEVMDEEADFPSD